MRRSALQNPNTVVVEGALEPNLLLEALNAGSGGFVQRYLQQHALLDQLSDQTLHSLVGAAVAVTTQLRLYVSEWIDTGRKADGEENPLDRRLHATRAAKQAMADFSSRYPVSTRIDNLGDPKQRLVCDVGCYSLLQGRVALLGTAQDAGTVWAQSLFFALLLSPWKHRICVCRRCRTFLLLPRAPRKGGYLRGVHCGSCSSAVSAIAITTRHRTDETEVLRRLAAKQCSALDCNSNPELIKQHAALLAEKVTKALEKLRGMFYEGRRIGRRTCSRKWIVTHAIDLAREQQRFESERGAKQKLRGPKTRACNGL